MKFKGMIDVLKSLGIFFVILCVCFFINECFLFKILDLCLCGDKECKSKWNLIKLVRDWGLIYFEFFWNFCFILYCFIFCNDYFDDIMLDIMINLDWFGCVWLIWFLKFCKIM